jgi:hypothetical protein
MPSRLLSDREVLLALIEYFNWYRGECGPSTEVGVPLSEWMLGPDGSSADPAATSDWREFVASVAPEARPHASEEKLLDIDLAYRAAWLFMHSYYQQDHTATLGPIMQDIAPVGRGEPLTQDVQTRWQNAVQGAPTADIENKTWAHSRALRRTLNDREAILALHRYLDKYWGGETSSTEVEVLLEEWRLTEKGIPANIFATKDWLISITRTTPEARVEGESDNAPLNAERAYRAAWAFMDSYRQRDHNATIGAIARDIGSLTRGLPLTISVKEAWQDAVQSTSASDAENKLMTSGVARKEAGY